MFRKPIPRDAVLEKLIEERDHLNIQVSLGRDSGELCAEELARLRKEHHELELLIWARQRDQSKNAQG